MEVNRQTKPILEGGGGKIYEAEPESNQSNKYIT